jgi:hypothetical protein
MATQAERLVRIEKDGVQKAVTEADYKRKKLVGLGGQTYESAGWKIVSFEDGTAYDAGEPATQFGLYKAARAPSIGTDGTNATNVDGDAVDAAHAQALGVTMASES